MKRFFFLSSSLSLYFIPKKGKKTKDQKTVEAAIAAIRAREEQGADDGRIFATSQKDRLAEATKEFPTLRKYNNEGTSNFNSKLRDTMGKCKPGQEKWRLKTMLTKEDALSKGLTKGHGTVQSSTAKNGLTNKKKDSGVISRFLTPDENPLLKEKEHQEKMIVGVVTAKGFIPDEGTIDPLETHTEY